MNQKYDRILAAILAALMLCCLLPGCAASPAPSTAPAISPETAEAFQDALFRLLATHEQLQSGLTRTVEYMDEFVRDGAWHSLLTARAACSAALVDVIQMELPEPELSQEQISALLDADIEINVLQLEFEQLERNRTEQQNTLSLLSYALEDDVFLKAFVEDSLPKMVENYRQIASLELRYYRNFANYLLLQAGTPEIWDQWSTRLPGLAACSGEWYDTTEDTAAAADGILDELELALSEMGSVLGTADYTLEVVREAVQTGDLEPLSREIERFDGVPGYFITPAWLPDVVHLYLVTDSALQEKRLVQAGEELTDAPSACYIMCGAVALEDLEAYEALLKSWEFETYGVWEEPDTRYQLLVNSGESTMMIDWTAGETLIYLTDPVGCLIPELYLAAMLTP